MNGDGGEEDDVGEAAAPRPLRIPRGSQSSSSGPNMARSPPNGPTSPLSAPGSPLATVHEVPSMSSSMTEEDLVLMSQSTSHAEPPHSRWASQVERDEDWLQSELSTKKTVVVEVSRPFCLTTSELIFLSAV